MNITKNIFAELVVKAVKRLNINLLERIFSVIGFLRFINHCKYFNLSSLLYYFIKDSELVKGVGFKKTFSYVEFKENGSFKDLLIVHRIRVKEEKENAQI